MSSDRLTLVDVGGLGGLKNEWAPHADRIRPIVFEPNPGPAAELRPKIEGEYGGKVVEMGLGNRREHRILNVTAAPGCTSLLTPNDAVLSAYSVRSAFEVRSREIVLVERFDALHATGEVPLPEAIKIDVQGYEYEVLEGFGETLQHCLGIEVEAHLYPIYKGQRLLADLIHLLSASGLTLRRVQPVANFDGYVVEVDAWFTCSPKRIEALSRSQVEKLDFLESVWDLPARRRKFPEGYFG